MLNRIEKAAPKLTIMVPDFSWVSENCFSVNRWETSSEYVAVGYDNVGDSHPLYYNGELLGNMPVLTYPVFPVLIVKSNERMIVRQDTKSGELSYDFVDPYFGRCNTKGTVEGYLENENVRRDLVCDNDDFISYSLLNTISPETINAYNTFGLGYGNGCQRDYTSYGMESGSSTSGHYNPYEKDVLYRFAISTSGLYSISGLDDPNISNSLSTGTGDRPGFDEAVRRLWGNGRYEIRIEVYHGTDNGYVRLRTIPFSLSPERVMYVTKCHYSFTWNIWGTNWSTYTIESNHIQPKWVYAHDEDISLCLVDDGWNLSAQSDNIWVNMSEYDDNTTINTSRAVTFRKANNTQVGFNSDVIKTSLGVEEESSESENYSISVVDGSDYLGDCYINYIDNVIVDSGNYRQGNGYQLKRYGSPLFFFSIIPCDVRNEYQVRQILHNRS